MGDWNYDGLINGTDLSLWQQNYAPLGYLGLLETTPEPGTLLLVSTGLLGLAAGVRRIRCAEPSRDHR